MRPSIARGAITKSAAGSGIVAAAAGAAVVAGAAASGPKLNPSTVAVVATPAWRCPAPHCGQAVGGFSRNTTAPSRSFTSAMTHGVMRKPPLANVEYPRAIDSGVSEAVPSDIDRFGGRLA